MQANPVKEHKLGRSFTYERILGCIALRSLSNFDAAFLAAFSSMLALVIVCSGRPCLVDFWSGVNVCRRKMNYNVSYTLS